ncbi:MAG: TIGR00300 family protein [Actinomycetia bacterium]|nr:TIGR00300 family protein [Actinomycetes bacterium]MCH9800976.1 TIGR00300 family protein [Actinomycetes bacterium]
MAATERVEMQGHVLDDGSLPKVLNEILGQDGDYVIERFEVGKKAEDSSVIRIAVTAASDEMLQQVINRLQRYGANLTEPGEPTLVTADVAGAFPEGFYSSTNLETEIFLDGHWHRVDRPEMDCGIVVANGAAATKPMSEIEIGDQVVVGAEGVRVRMEPRSMNPDESAFEFMNSVVSSEKPQALQVRNIADDFRRVKAEGNKILWVGGPAIVHTGSGPAMVALVEAGFVDVLFAGNALATHDIESNMYGTSLGVDLSNATGVDHGHEHHLRAINRVRRAGSIAAAVEAGTITGGIMHAMVKNDKKFILVGSARDDGPLPDVYTDVIEGQQAMRAAIHGVGYSIMVATMLHAIATGNLLPAAVPLVCVDINPATVTKLSDRGSAQAVGVVTDIGLFMEQLATELVPGYHS